jgi:enoyl-CoA hydratase/carnithine racemase
VTDWARRFDTIGYEVAADDRVATITLDRPEVLNAFDRQICEELRAIWHEVEADDAVNAVVLRAAGDRAFSAGLDTSKSFGRPDVVWNHDVPGEFLSPKWQRCWKPVVCAVHGMCAAGALCFVNEADVATCSDDATYGYVSALEPIGLVRRIGLGDPLRMVHTGNCNRECVSAATALRLGLVTDVEGRGVDRTPPIIR